MVKVKSSFPDKKSNTAFGIPTSKSGPEWQSTVGMYIAGQSEIDELDQVALEVEQRWGCDRLRLLVSVELREKFDRQRYLTNQAIWHGTLQDVIRETKRMISAWRVLDKAAAASKAEQLPPEVWEVALPDGQVVALVKTLADLVRVSPDKRWVSIYTLDEIAHLIQGFPELVKAKQVFAGSHVTAIRRSIGDPLQSIPDSKAPIDDEMPF